MERNLGWLLVAARLLVAIVFLLNGFGIIDQTIPAREMVERGVPASHRAGSRYAVGTAKSVKCGLDCGLRFWDNPR